MIENTKQYYSIKSLGERWEVGRSTIYDWIKAGYLPKPEKIGPHLARFHIDTVHEFEQSHIGKHY